MPTRSSGASELGARTGLIGRLRFGLAAAGLLLAATWLVRADVPTGSRDKAAYLGYDGLTADRLEFDAPEVLAKGGAAGDMLVSRFFAPKIMNVKFNEGDAAFKLGWRKLVRLKAKPGSTAQKSHIAAAVILFNTFTAPGDEPFARGNFSVNTQVMLLPDPAFIRPLPGQPGDGTMDSIYWLDFQAATATAPGKLGYALNASFDANELPGAGTKDYFVPQGCVACHGNNEERPIVNFLDTDHWFDRLNTDFPKLKASNRALLYDAGTNDPTDKKFKDALDVIRTFNQEAHQYAKAAQPNHDEVLAASKWLEVHTGNDAPVPPIKRAIGKDAVWAEGQAGEVAVLETMNRYCYRCHGTIKFSVFNKGSVVENKVKLRQRLAADAEVGLKMPPDRELPQDKRDQILKDMQR